MSEVPPPRAAIVRLAFALAVAVALYVALAYGAAPFAWRYFEHQTRLAGKAMITTTKFGVAGDALNVGIEGERADLFCVMRAAGWNPADPVTLLSSLHIVSSVLARRAYPDAPVSPLVYDGRTQDLAFEKPSGISPSTRHHVRFWRVLDQGDSGRPVWLGSATFDRSVGVSHYTAQVTHHIAPDIDAERALLSKDLAATGHVEATYSISGIGPTLFARNGGGDPYFTDGEIEISRLRPDCEAKAAAPVALESSAGVKAKGVAFGWWAWVWRKVL